MASIRPAIENVFSPVPTGHRSHRRFSENRAEIVGYPGAAILGSTLILAALFTGLSVGNSPLAFAVAGLGLFLVCLGVGHVALLVLILALATMPLLSLSSGIDTRYAAVVPLLTLLLRAPKQALRWRNLRIPVFLAVVTGTSFASAIWHGQVEAIATASAALALLTSACFVVAATTSQRQMVKAGYLLFSALLWGSLAVAILGLPIAQLGLRVRGLIANPNGLGIVALLAVIFALLQSKKAFWFSVFPAIILVLWSASRGSGLALLILLATALLHYAATRWGRIGGIAGMLLAVAGISIYLYAYRPFPNSGIFRTGNSREDVWAALIKDFQSSPVFGVGWKNVSTSSEGFFHLMAAQAGLVGLGLALTAVVLIIASLGRVQPFGIALALAILVAITFEGWLLVGGSGYAWAIWLLASSRIIDPLGRDEGQYQTVNRRRKQASDSGRTKIDSTPSVPEVMSHHDA